MMSTRFFPVVVTLAVVCCAQLGFGADNIFVQAPTTYDGPDYMPGQIIVKFRPGVPENAMAQIHRANNATVARTSRFAGFQVLTFPESIPPQAMANIYARNPNVEYAELNHIAHAFVFPGDPPNDPLYAPYQWHLSSINMEQAWTISDGAGVTVAVIDTGVKLGGPDGVPASGGYDFVNNDSNPDDDNGHGTHVAGTIAQNTNNGVGVAGVAFGCSILPVKVLNRRGSGTYDQIADGIYYAAEQSAKVINMSLGGSATSITLENAVASAYNQGVTIVCAAGNDGTSTVSYPAAYNDYCIAVGATRYDETRAYYSNYGSSLDLCAPGGDVNVDQNGDGYGDGVLQETYYSRSWGYWFFQGTSMASPHVAGVAALVISKGITNPDEVRNILQSTAKDVGATGKDSTYGWGIVDAYKAVTEAMGEPDITPPAAPTGLTATPGDTTVTLNWSPNGEADLDGYRVYRDNTLLTTALLSDFTFTDTGLTNGQRYTYEVTAVDTTGNESSPSTVSATPIASTDDTPPAAPADLTATPGDTTVNLSWSPNTENDLDGYNVYRDDTLLNTTGLLSNCTFTDTGLTNGQMYTYSVTAVDTSGNESSPSTASATPQAGGGTTIHVEFVDEWAEARTAGKNVFVRALVVVRVLDSHGQEVGGATVTGQWSVGNTATATTGDDGVATLVSNEVKTKGAVVFVLTITSVEKADCTYDSGSSDTYFEVYYP